jgi:hypothetical protein
MFILGSYFDIGSSVPYQIKPLSSRLELILIKSSQADLKSIQAETKPNQAGLI